MEKPELILVPESDDECSPSSQTTRELRSNTKKAKREEKPQRAPSLYVPVYQEIFPLAAMDKRIYPLSLKLKMLAYGNLFPQWTDDVGRYLMDLGFPIVGVGSLTLCFLINEEYVIKVPKIAQHDCRPGDESSYRKCPACCFNAERSRDLGMYQEYPNAWAKTELMYIDLPNEYGRHYRVYVQERLIGPFERHGIPPDVLKKQHNAPYLIELVKKNRDVKQYAKRTDGTLVYFDYH
jgi:hypothetical protein